MILDFEPKNVFKFFESLCNIPHGSGNEKEISDYIVNFAKERNLWVHQDSFYNVIIKKEGTLGYEQAPTIIIQAHIDMVCEKNADTTHDFFKDPIKLVVDGDMIKANGTTLGADNGIAVAMAMALIDSKDIDHPPLEILLTATEETGMVGAAALDASLLNGKTLINMDTEEEGVFITSCAGGRCVTLKIPVETEEPSEQYEFFELKVFGLKGGHSGMDAAKHRANANVMIGSLLSTFVRKFNIRFGELNGGIKENAIPREARAVIAVKKYKVETLMAEFNNLKNLFKGDYKVSDPNIEIQINKCGRSLKMFSKKLCEKLISVSILMPSGIHSMSLDIPGLVQSSANLGVVMADDEYVTYVCSVRSSIVAEKVFLTHKIKLLAALVGGVVEITGDYPAWEFNRDSNIRKIFLETYAEQYGKEAEVTAIHAGLECGILSGKLDKVDIISFGPNIYDAHTPDERVSISSVTNVWFMLVSALAKIK